MRHDHHHGLRIIRGVLGIAVCVMLLSACAGGSGTFEPAILDEGRAMVYVYRPSAGVFGGPRLLLYVDQELIGALPSGRYVDLIVLPGSRLVRIEGRSDAVREARLLAGETAYFEVDTAWDGMPTITQPDTDEARRRIARTRRLHR